LRQHDESRGIFLSRQALASGQAIFAGQIRSSTIREYSSRPSDGPSARVSTRGTTVNPAQSQKAHQAVCAIRTSSATNQDFRLRCHALSHLVQVVSIVAEAACVVLRHCLQEVFFCTSIFDAFSQPLKPAPWPFSSSRSRPKRCLSVILPGLPLDLEILHMESICLGASPANWRSPKQSTPRQTACEGPSVPFIGPYRKSDRSPGDTQLRIWKSACRYLR